VRGIPTCGTRECFAHFDLTFLPVDRPRHPAPTNRSRLAVISFGALSSRRFVGANGWRREISPERTLAHSGGGAASDVVGQQRALPHFEPIEQG
jgi:hypothetical protein